MESTNLEFIIPNIDVFEIQEHSSFKEEHIDYIRSLNLKLKNTDYEGTPQYLGITPDLKASYYIGADWLNDTKAVVVTPKMPNIDFIEMYLCALRFAPSAEYFSKFYCIDFEKPAIKTHALNSPLTPLLILHFLSVLQRLIKIGLKKGYVYKEENLKSKIRGKILITQNIRKNIIIKREERLYCKFQEYTVDIPENRLLKKALIFANRAICSFDSFQHHTKLSDIKRQMNNLLLTFENVSEDIEVNQVKKIATNKLYKDYSEATRLAQMILRKFDYSIKNITEVQESTPPFWIDMSRLYEVYVYSLLEATYPGQVIFQENGHYCTAVDFLKPDEKLIMDTKYKPDYSTSNAYIINDIREISGYARDEKILKTLGITNNEFTPPCLIIYPDNINNSSTSLNNKNFVQNQTLISQSHSIKTFRKFYKIGISLPIK
jgi:5-methylcytosine-specific restriction enzyme subunit McrC